MKHLATIGLAGALALALTGPIWAKTVLKLNESAGPGSPEAIALQSFKSEVESRTSGDIEIQVNLLDKGDRSLQSHDIAKIVRPEVQKIASKYGANVKIVEVPPGPPVLSTLVAEIYGPDYDEQIKVAYQVKEILENHENCEFL